MQREKGRPGLLSCWREMSSNNDENYIADQDNQLQKSGKSCNTYSINYLQLVQLKIVHAFFQQKGCGRTFLFYKQ